MLFVSSNSNLQFTPNSFTTLTELTKEGNLIDSCL